MRNDVSRFCWRLSASPGRVSYGPQGTDRDLLDLMNLPYPNAHYAVPELTYYSIPPRTSCHSAAITEVGGSFLFVLNSTLAKA